MKLIATAAGAAFILLVPAVASAQDGTNYRVRAGLGAQILPDFPGSDSTEILPYPALSIAKGDDLFSVGAPDDNFGIALINSGGFSAGPSFNLESARHDSDVGVPVGDVKTSIEAGVFAQQLIGDHFRVRGDIRKGLSGHKGIVGSVGADYMARDADNWTFTVGPRVRFGDKDYMDAYFGVHPAVSIATPLPIYKPDGGIRALGLASGFTYSLGGPFGLFGYARYDHLVGDAGKSPIVREYGSRNQLSGGLGLSYIFNLRL